VTVSKIVRQLAREALSSFPDNPLGLAQHDIWQTHKDR
jgi:hypothetical protein